MLPSNLDNLTKRDMDILNILWKSEEPLTASQIASADEGLTINTVQAVIVYSGTVLCRSYCPAISADDFALFKFNNEYQKMKDRLSKSTLMASLLGSETDSEQIKRDIDDLESLLDEYKQK